MTEVRAPALVLFGGVATLLVLLAAPDAVWLDSGELAASFFGLGVSHPTGFPLLHPPAKALTLVPLGGIGFRANLLSALAGAGTIAALFVAILGAVGALGPERPSSAAHGRLPAALGALGLLGAATFWQHSLTLEVYVPTALALALYLAGLLPLLAGSPEAPLARRRLAFLAFGFGLGLGTHVTFPLVAGAATLPLAVRLLARRTTRAAAVRFVPALLLLVGLGALVLLYLPAVASRGPFRNWGDPSTTGRLLEHLTGARIRRMFASELGELRWATVAAHAAMYGRLVLAEVGTLLVPAAGGALWLLRRRPAVLVALALALAADAVFSIKINPMGLSDHQTSVPSYLLLHLLSGVGLVQAARLLAFAFPTRPALAAAAVTVPVLGLWAPIALDAPHARDLSRAGGATALVRQAMDHAPPGALFLTSSDSLCALAAFVQGVENHRPDLAWVIKQQLWDPLYLPALATPAHGAVVSPALVAAQARLVDEGRNFEGAAQQGLLVALVREYVQAGRPVLFEPGDGVLDAPFLAHLVPGMPLWRLSPTPTALPPDVDGFDALTQPALRTWRASVPETMAQADRETLAHWLRLAATVYVRRGPLEVASVLSQRAVRVAPHDARVLSNAAVVLSREGRIPAAARAAAAAVEAQPDYALAWLNFAGFSAALGEAGDAYRAFDRALALAPSPHAARRATVELARMHAAHGEVAVALWWVGRARAAQPDDPELRTFEEQLGREVARP